MIYVKQLITFTKTTLNKHVYHTIGKSQQTSKLYLLANGLDWQKYEKCVQIDKWVALKIHLYISSLSTWTD